MSRDKQIEEIAKILCGMKNGCDGCMWNKVHCNERNYAEEIYNAGYRKASEIFEEIEKIKKRLCKRQAECEKEAKKAGYYLAMRCEYDGESAGIDKCLNELAELKNKYESEKEK
jgi:hypothetical protein